MALTVQDALDLARKPLKDAAKARYPDVSLLVYYNQAIGIVLDRRPDLFVGSYTSLPTGQSVATDAFPLPPRFLQTVADWITGSGDIEEDELADSGRSKVMFEKFLAQLGA